MVCKKIRKAREYPSQSKRSASLRRCIQRGTVQSRCTTQVHGDRKNAYLLVCCQHFSLNTLETASSRCSAMCIYPRDDLLHLRDYYLINIQATNRRNQEREHVQAFRFCVRLTLDKTVWIVKEICAQLFVCTILVYAWSWQKPETSSNATNATYLSHRPLFQTLETPKTAQTKCSTACLVISTLSW